jgi:hypothetical protein
LVVDVPILNPLLTQETKNDKIVKKKENKDKKLHKTRATIRGLALCAKENPRTHEQKNRTNRRLSTVFSQFLNFEK